MHEIDSEPVQSGLEVRSVVARPVPLGRRHDRVDASDGLMVVVDLATNSAIAAGEMKRRQPMTTLAGGPHRAGGSGAAVRLRERADPRAAKDGVPLSRD
jgi:hypothetical protein